MKNTVLLLVISILCSSFARADHYLGIENSVVDAAFKFNNTEDFDFFA